MSQFVRLSSIHESMPCPYKQCFLPEAVLQLKTRILQCQLTRAKGGGSGEGLGYKTPTAPRISMVPKAECAPLGHPMMTNAPSWSLCRFPNNLHKSASRGNQSRFQPFYGSGICILSNSTTASYSSMMVEGCLIIHKQSHYKTLPPPQSHCAVNSCLIPGYGLLPTLSTVLLGLFT